MGDGTEQNPYTREDVLRLIEQNGGKAEGLDLSNRTFAQAIDLSCLDLSGTSLTNVHLCNANFNDAVLIHANFNGSDLDEATMQRANLQHATFNFYQGKAATLLKTDLRGAYLKNAEFLWADLAGAQFQKDPEKSLHATLEEADFRNANLTFAKFGDCRFYRTRLEGASIEGADITNDARIGYADWGNYVIGEEKESKFDIAEHRYRQLKQWYSSSGYYDIAAKFYYREKEAHRKLVQFTMARLLKNHDYSKFIKLTFREEGGWTLLWSWVYRLLCGYGEKTLRIVGWTVLVILILASIYFIIGSVWEWSAFWKSLYFSAVSFTALGYGSWVNETWIGINNNWIKGLGVTESFIGVFMMALFLVTFTRKMTR